MRIFKLISLLVLVTFISSLFGSCASTPSNSYSSYITGGAFVGGIGLFLLARHLNSTKGERQAKKQQALLEKDRQQRIKAEASALEKDPVLIGLSELINNYYEKISGRYIVMSKIDYSSDRFIDDGTSFWPSSIEFEDANVKKVYSMKKPDEYYELGITLKGVDSFSLWVTGIKGKFYTESEKLSYDNELAEQRKIEQDRFEAERLAAEKAEADRAAAEKAAAEKAEADKMKNFIFGPKDFLAEKASKYKNGDLFDAVVRSEKLLAADTVYGFIIYPSEEFVSDVVFISQDVTDVRVKNFQGDVAKTLKVAARLGLKNGQRIRIYYSVYKIKDWDIAAVELL
jgi:hypothetical protein